MQIPIVNLADSSESPTLAKSTYVTAHCEVTGLDPKVDAVFDVALVRFERGEPTQRFTSLVYPQRAIPDGISTACSISNLDVMGEPTLEELMPRLRDFIGADPIVAHDPEISYAFLKEIRDCEWISLVELAGRVWPFATDYSCKGLLEHTQLEHPALLDLPVGPAEEEAVITGLLFRRAIDLLKIDDFNQLDDLQQLMRRRTPVHDFRFGQEYRRPLHAIPEYYLRWVLDDADKLPRLRTLHLDKNTLYAIRVHLALYRRGLPELCNNLTR